MNSQPMTWRNAWILLLAIISIASVVVPQSEPEDAAENMELGKASEKTPTVKQAVESKSSPPVTLDQVISPLLKYMAVPQNRPKIIGSPMQVATPSEKAQSHVKQGFALVHAQWDFEAYRHFCVALQEDPDCLMAYVGVALALAKPHNEFVAYRRAAVKRMLDLLEADKRAEDAGKAGRFPEVEKEFAAAVATLVSTSPRTAGVMFLKLSKDYPNFMQSRVLALLLSRGGYDVSGDPTPRQQVAVQRARALLKKNSTNPSVIGLWLTLNAETPLSAIDFKAELLPQAKKLVEMDPDIPSWQYLLGHYQWRVGDYASAQTSFAKSAELYALWMKEEGVGVNDCAGYLRAQSYLVNSHYQAGDFTQAMKVAKVVRSIKLDPKRPQSPGNGMLMWCSHNLPARLYIARAAKGDMNLALKSLPSPKEMKPLSEHDKYPTLAGVFNDALAMYVGCRKAIGQKDLKAAVSLHRGPFRKHIQDLAAVSKGASQVSDYGHYIRAGSALSVYDMELAALIAMAGPKKTRVVAAGRFLSARDKQQAPSGMMSSIVMSPMDNRLGDYYLSAGDSKLALDAYSQGDLRYPNNQASLLGMKHCLITLKKQDEAELIQKRLDQLKAGQ